MRYFVYSEFDQPGVPESGQKFMDKLFLTNLDALRHKCGFPFIITSGYRSPEYNNKVSKTGRNGPHTFGKAADILVSRKNVFIVLKNAFEMGCFMGFGIKQHGENRYIHIDSLCDHEGPRPNVWSYK